jgi:hypothetical protein
MCGSLEFSPFPPSYFLWCVNFIWLGLLWEVGMCVEFELGRDPEEKNRAVFRVTSPPSVEWMEMRVCNVLLSPRPHWGLSFLPPVSNLQRSYWLWYRRVGGEGEFRRMNGGEREERGSRIIKIKIISSSKLWETKEEFLAFPVLLCPFPMNIVHTWWEGEWSPVWRDEIMERTENKNSAGISPSTISEWREKKISPPSHLSLRPLNVPLS